MWRVALYENTPWVTEGLSIRPMTPDDAEFYFEMQNNVEVRRHLGGSLNLELNETRASLVRNQGNPNLPLIVTDTETHIDIGYTCFPDNPTLEDTDLLIALLPEFQSQGNGREILEVMLQKCREIGGKEYCLATVSPGNMGSIRLITNAGFEFIFTAFCFSSYQVGYTCRDTP